MSPRIYTREIKEAVVKYYERNHTIAEAIKEFGVSETSLFEWKKLYDQAHDLVIDGSSKYKYSRQSQNHFQKRNLC